MTTMVTRQDFPPEYFDVKVWVTPEPEDRQNTDSSVSARWPHRFGVISAPNQH